jgi:hypothetical protein
MIYEINILKVVLSFQFHSWKRMNVWFKTTQKIYQGKGKALSPLQYASLRLAY